MKSDDISEAKTEPSQPSGGIRLGLARGLIRYIPPDFDAPLDPELLLTKIDG